MPMPALILVLCLPGRRQTTCPRTSIGLRRRPRRMATTTLSPIASGLRVGKKIAPVAQLRQVPVQESRPHSENVP